jgi:hypothetical protein
MNAFIFIVAFFIMGLIMVAILTKDIVCGFVGALGCTVVALFLCSLGNMSNETTASKTFEIYSVSNDKEIVGDMFLLIGSINEEEYVYYWAKNDNGALVKEKVKMSFAEFFEDCQDGEGYVVVTYHTIKTGWWSFDNNKLYPMSYSFHIPENSINYKFLLQ